MSTTTKPWALADIAPRAHDSKVWLLLDGEYVEVSRLVSRAEVKWEAGRPTKLTIEIPVAATGTPPEKGQNHAACADCSGCDDGGCACTACKGRCAL